jgi:hypothetical protein
MLTVGTRMVGTLTLMVGVFGVGTLAVTVLRWTVGVVTFTCVDGRLVTLIWLTLLPFELVLRLEERSFDQCVVVWPFS